MFIFSLLCKSEIRGALHCVKKGRERLCFYIFERGLLCNIRVYSVFTCEKLYIYSGESLRNNRKGLTEMKIQRLNEQATEKMKFRRESFDDDIAQIKASLGIEVPPDANPVYLLSVDGTYVLEITLEEVREILKAKGYPAPELMGAPQVGILEKLDAKRRQRK